MINIHSSQISNLNMECPTAEFASAFVVKFNPCPVLVKTSPFPLQISIVGIIGGPNKRREQISGAAETIEKGPRHLPRQQRKNVSWLEGRLPTVVPVRENRRKRDENGEEEESGEEDQAPRVWKKPWKVFHVWKKQRKIEDELHGEREKTKRIETF